MEQDLTRKTNTSLEITNGFVLMNTRAGHEKNVFFALKKMPGIEEVHMLYGEYDILVKVSGESAQDVAQKIVADVRSIDGVKQTKTHIEIFL